MKPEGFFFYKNDPFLQHKITYKGAAVHFSGKHPDSSYWNLKTIPYVKNLGIVVIILLMCT